MNLVRLIGICLMLAGIYFVAGFPFVEWRSDGHYLEYYTVYNRDKSIAWNSPQVEIYLNDNPLRIEYTAFFDHDGINPDDGIVVRVKLTGPDGVVVDDAVSLVPKFNARNKSGSQVASDVGPLFVVRKPGTYTLDMSLKDKEETTLIHLFATIYGRVAVVDMSYLKIGTAMLVVGFILIFYRRKDDFEPGPRDDDDDDFAEFDTDSKTSKPKKIIWGRNTDSN